MIPPPVTQTLVLYAGMVVAGAALAAWTGCPSLFRAPPDGLRLVGSLALALLAAFAVVRGGRLLEGRAWYRDMALVMRRIVTAPQLLGPELDRGRALTLAIYSSVGEEALFRGFLQPWLIARLAGALALAPDSALAAGLGVAGTSALFALLHPPLVPALRPWTAFALAAGLLFGGLAAWSGSLLAPVVAHLVINWLNLLRLTELAPDAEGDDAVARGRPER